MQSSPALVILSAVTSNCMSKKPTKAELKKIRQSLPNAKRQLVEDHDIYNRVFISVFDKWLTPEEVDKISKLELKELFERRQKLEAIIMEFYELTETYIWRYKRHKRIVFYKPSSLTHLLNRCDIKNQNWWHGHRYHILLPEFSAIYGEEWDWTNILWYIDKEKIKPLLKLAENSGLHILHDRE